MGAMQNGLSLPCIIALIVFIQRTSATSSVCGSGYGAMIDGLESDFEVFSEHVRKRVLTVLKSHQSHFERNVI